jgi:hypothetical protein
MHKAKSLRAALVSGRYHFVSLSFFCDSPIADRAPQVETSAPSGIGSGATAGGGRCVPYLFFGPQNMC